MEDDMAGRMDLTEAEDLDRRREVVALALAKLPNTSAETGIYGYETCQICGEIGYFSTFAGAMMRHGIWSRRADEWKDSRGLFIAAWHDHSDYSPADLETGFCEVCRCASPRDHAHRVAHHVLCGACLRAFADAAPDGLWFKMLSQFVRERWRYHAIIERDDAGWQKAYPHLAGKVYGPGDEGQ
jgi:hypothetical protein